MSDQFEAAQDKRTHDDFAQLNVGLHELLERMTIKLEHLAVLAHLSANQSATSGQHVQLASEAAGRVSCDEHIALRAWLNDFNLSRDEHEEPCCHLALFDQHFTCSYCTPLSGGGYARNLRRCEGREELLATFRR